MSAINMETPQPRRSSLSILAIPIVIIVVVAALFGYYYMTSTSTIANLNNTISARDSTINQDQSTISSLKSTISQLQGNISTLQANVTSLIMRRDTLTSELNSAKANISSLQSQVNTLNANLTSLSLQLSNDNTAISSLQSQLDLQNSTVELGTTTETVTMSDTCSSSGGGYVCLQVASFPVSHAGYILVSATSVSAPNAIGVDELNNYTSYDSYNAIEIPGGGQDYLLVAQNTLAIPVLPGTVTVYLGLLTGTSASATISIADYW